MLIIWGRLNSHNVKKVAWAAQEMDLPHERRDIGGKFGYTDAYLAMNPNSLVPTIDDDGFVLWESNAILRYLAARYAPALWPQELQARARADRWMDWQFSFADAQRDAFLGMVRHRPEERDLESIARSAARAGQMMGIVERYLNETPWLSGEQFGIADISMGVYAHTFFTIDVDRPHLPMVERWYARLRERPGYASQVMIPLS